ncbi:hypothetical protein QR680_010007 [Steinernema hermaphroditum]|uniref:Uncharacterized protein n=1 Tax=Steinernema hermaphroditum TaxID=289476 RepID=A0AA39IPU9_9BILA|nr:hypothetical protein QR680_010007 [Steinernema hermaphroditum]
MDLRAEHAYAAQIYGVDQNLIDYSVLRGTQPASRTCSWPCRTAWPGGRSTNTDEDVVISIVPEFVEQTDDEVSALVLVRASNLDDLNKLNNIHFTTGQQKHPRPDLSKHIELDTELVELITRNLKDAVVFYKDSTRPPSFGQLQPLFDLAHKKQGAILLQNIEPDTISWQRCEKEAVASPHAVVPLLNVRGDLRTVSAYFHPFWRRSGHTLGKPNNCAGVFPAAPFAVTRPEELQEVESMEVDEVPNVPTTTIAAIVHSGNDDAEVPAAGDERPSEEVPTSCSATERYLISRVDELTRKMDKLQETCERGYAEVSETAASLDSGIRRSLSLTVGALPTTDREAILRMKYVEEDRQRARVEGASEIPIPGTFIFTEATLRNIEREHHWLRVIVDTTNDRLHRFYCAICAAVQDWSSDSGPSSSQPRPSGSKSQHPFFAHEGFDDTVAIVTGTTLIDMITIQKGKLMWLLNLKLKKIWVQL